MSVWARIIKYSVPGLYMTISQLGIYDLVFQGFLGKALGAESKLAKKGTLCNHLPGFSRMGCQLRMLVHIKLKVCWTPGAAANYEAKK